MFPRDSRALATRPGFETARPCHRDGATFKRWLSKTYPSSQAIIIASPAQVIAPQIPVTAATASVPSVRTPASTLIQKSTPSQNLAAAQMLAAPQAPAALLVPTIPHPVAPSSATANTTPPQVRKKTRMSSKAQAAPLRAAANRIRKIKGLNDEQSQQSTSMMNFTSVPLDAARAPFLTPGTSATDLVVAHRRSSQVIDLAASPPSRAASCPRSHRRPSLPQTPQLGPLVPA